MPQPGETFKEIRTLESLLLRPQDKGWLEKPPSQPSPAATILNLGCNILRTPHLAQTLVGICQQLGEDFIALGGPAFSCGVHFPNEGAMGKGRQQGERLAAHFERFKPQQVVMWCPGCLYYYKNILPLSGPFRLLHITEFLAEKRDRLTFAPLPPTKVALHYHCGTPDADRQAAAARALLGTVPGIEVVEMGSTPAWGRQCSGNLRERMGQQAWEALIMPYFEKAATAGVQVFATLYHGCHRMYAGYEGRFPFTIENYLTLLGRALGIVYPDKYKRYLLWKDACRILEDSHPCVEANRLPLEQAIATVENVFVKDCGL